MSYDNLKRDLSFQYNKIIKEYGDQDNIPRIYCDLDGTLCDFVAQLRIITGKSVSEWDRMKNKWDAVLNTPRFWETIPWHKEGKKLWNFIAPFKPHILTAYLEKIHDPNCIPGKSKWIRTNLGVRDTSRIHFCRRRDKQFFALRGNSHREPSILIDDYLKTINEFNNRKGLGIYFSTANDAITRLQKIIDFTT